MAAQVRWQRSGVPPAWGFWPNLGGLAFQRGLRKICEPLKIDPFPAANVVDLAQWFRNEWASATEKILFSERTLSRGIVKPDALRSLWSAHRKGADLSRQLGVLITLEYFARMAIDGESFNTIGPDE